MKTFGENLGLETIEDEVGNVIIKKPASKGMEDRKTVVLQSTSPRQPVTIARIHRTLPILSPDLP